MGVRRKGTAVAAIATGVVALIGVQVGIPARAATAPVPAGVATAGGALLGVIPGVSGLTLTTTFGEARAAYEESQSEATSASVDLGGLGFYLANEPVCGNSIPEKDQPQPLTANSGDGASNRSSGLSGVAAEKVSVDPSPERASATTSLLSASLPGILTVKGESDASVAYQANTEQEADATVTEDVSLLGGLVTLDGMTWTASRHSGATNVASGHFTLGKVTVGGVALSQPAVSTAAEVTAVNTVIGALGFNLVLPSPDTAQGAVTVGPLVVHFSGATAERTAVNPVIGPVTDLEGKLNGASTPGNDCSKFPELLYNVDNQVDSLVNLQLAIVRGAGSLDINLGGVNAGVTELPGYTDPFANPLGGSGPSAGEALPHIAGASVPGTARSTDASGGLAALSGAGSGASGGLPVPAGGAAGGGSNGGMASAPAHSPDGVSVCRTTSPAGPQGCWKGPATLAAGFLLAGGTGVLAADVAYGHRRRRRRRGPAARRGEL